MSRASLLLIIRRYYSL